MLNSLKKNKILLGVFVVVTVIFLWSTLSGGGTPTPSSSLLTSTTQTSRVTVDQDIVRLLLDMQVLKLDGSVFNTPAFVLLRDFGREIVPEPIGRQNPFAPVTTSPAVNANTSATEDGFFNQ